MGIISNTHLQATLDKLARWAGTAVGDDGLDDAFTAGFTAANAAVMSGSGSHDVPSALRVRWFGTPAS